MPLLRLLLQKSNRSTSDPNWQSPRSAEQLWRPTSNWLQMRLAYFSYPYRARPSPKKRSRQHWRPFYYNRNVIDQGRGVNSNLNFTLSSYKIIWALRNENQKYSFFRTVWQQSPSSHQRPHPLPWPVSFTPISRIIKTCLTCALSHICRWFRRRHHGWRRV